MIERVEYRGCLCNDLVEADWDIALKEAEKLVCAAKAQGKVLTACLYRKDQMLFLYLERLETEIIPEELLAPLSAYLQKWPEENGATPWALMYPIYYHSIPETKKEWERERLTNENRIGRIAFVKPEKLFSYTYWHYAIVQEGLLKGDKYQFISLHENILFSYFEEPRHNVNLSGSEESSKVIEEWLAVDPESHFDREKAQGENFLVITPILQV